MILDGPRRAPTLGSVPLTLRAGGPDLARGIALLGIGAANTVGWLHGERWTVLLKQADAGGWDRAVDVLVALLADNRGFPLFAMLFGFGLGVMHRRSAAAGESARRFLLRMLRRLAVLAAIGLAHAILLFQGDILVAYAVIGMLCAVLVTRRTWVLLVGAALGLPSLALWGWTDGTIGLGGGTGYASAQTATWAEAVAMRAPSALEDLALAPITDLGLLAPMAIGAILARTGLLEDVGRWRTELVGRARWGLGIGLVGALPLTGVLLLDPHLQTVSSEAVLGVLGMIHQLSGLIGAIGIAAACSLLADRAASSGRAASARALGALEALGATALSAYIAQSLALALLMPPYALDLGARLGSAGATAIVAGIWLATLVLAALWRRTGRRGLLEAVLRRLGGSARPTSARPTSAPTTSAPTTSAPTTTASTPPGRWGARR
ncbi:DUF418 domain-containing protein [Brachybacterium sp. DNPG3]